MTIQERLVADMKDAMRGGDKTRVETIRTIRAALQAAQLEHAKQKYDEEARRIEREISNQDEREAALAKISADPHVPLDDAAAISVLQKEIKRRRDAAEMYHKGQRPELAAAEEAEAAVIEAYLPKMLSADELKPEVAALIAELGLSGASSMGKLMPALMERFKGRADGRVISQVARELLK